MRQVDAGLLAEAELGQVGVGFFDAQLEAEAVEEGVGGDLYRFHQVGRAVAAAHGVAEHVFGAGDAPRAGGGDDGAGADFAAFEQSHAHEGFEGGTGRVETLGYTVDHGFLPVFVEGFPAFAVDAVDKQVGIEGGVGDKGQHAAGLRVDGHHRAAFALHQAHGVLLQADVHCQFEGLAVLRRYGFDGADDVAVGVFFHFAVARNAQELAFVIAFEAGFADVGAAPVEGGEFFFAQPRLVFVADAADVAEKVGGLLAVGGIRGRCGR